MKKQLLSTVNRALILSAFVLSGCMTLKTQVRNSPGVQLSGPKTYVKVADDDGKAIGGPAAEIIKDESYKFLSAKGFQRVDLPADAHVILFFNPGGQTRQVEVPGHTFSYPVYGSPQTTTFSAYSSNGNSVTGYATTTPQKQWQTGYREGYTASVQDQWIMGSAVVQKNGARPRPLYEGQVFRTKTDWEFLGDESHLRSGIREFLNSTSLNSVERAPAATDSGRPGCRYMVGFQLNNALAKKEKRFVIESIIPASPAEQSKLREGDEIKSFAGLDYADFSSDPERADRLYQQGEIKIVYAREGKQQAATLTPAMICPD